MAVLLSVAPSSWGGWNPSIERLPPDSMCLPAGPVLTGEAGGSLEFLPLYLPVFRITSSLLRFHHCVFKSLDCQEMVRAIHLLRV